MLDAKWTDIDLDRRAWRIHINKSGKARHVPLSSSVVQLLTDLTAYHGVLFGSGKKSEWIFVNPDTGKPYVQMHYSWDTARKQACLDGFRMHDLRHTFASFLINAGRSLYEVQKILGHTQIPTTQRYSHLSQDTLLAAADTAVEALGEHVRSAAEQACFWCRRVANDLAGSHTCDSALGSKSRIRGLLGAGTNG